MHGHIQHSKTKLSNGETMNQDLKQILAFQKAIAENPYDRKTRLVFADWLEEHGLDDEAHEQRSWSKTKQEAEDWLRNFAPEINMTYQELLLNGDQILTGNFCLYGDVIHEMEIGWPEFKKYWCILKGIGEPTMGSEETRFSCVC